MRVALLAQNAYAGDAVGNQLAGKVRYFAEHGWEIRVYLTSAERLHPAVAPYCAAAPDRVWRNRSERAYLRQADLIVAEYGVDYELLHLLPVLAGKKAKILVDYHGVTPANFWGPAHRHRLDQAAQQRGLIWCADAAIVHSQFTADELRQATAFPPSRTCQLPCFIDVKRFTPGQPPIDVRRNLGLVGAKVLLFVGRLAANKRVPLLIEALARLPEKMSPVHAVIVGDNCDIYDEQAQACRQLAEQRRIPNRVHILGSVDEATLLSWYRSADVFVMPSLHEGFCVPIAEAMACGLPVVAARTSALPETVGDAGLTFEPENADDLARQIERVLLSRSTNVESIGRVAIVSPRYGTDFVGGAEASLRTMARALRDEGLNVEVFTTCNRHDWQWANHHPAGTSTIDGIAVHRFPIDPHDRELHLAALDAIRRGNGVVSDVDEAAYLTNSLRSTALVEALAKREREFDAIIAGPYLFGLTWEIARRFNSQVLLAPCFHDEPIARLRRFRQTYAAVGGILYHSPEEQALAERTLGINHPYASVVGTSLDLPKATATLRAPAQPEPPYVVYCGRYSPEKGINTLLEFATRYSTDQPNRFRFVLMGEGRIESPDAPWLVNKGFVPDSVKREVMANARALIQLSTNESLSLVTLEAWAAGIPVIGHRDCAAVRGLVERSGGGAVIGDYAEFAKMMDDLWDYSDRWREAGAAGQRYVLKNYASRPAFAGRLQAAIAALGTPLAEQMRRKGLARAQQFGYSEWEKAFGELLARTLQGDEPSGRLELEVTPLVQNKTARPNDRTAVVPVRLTNHGTLPAAAKGPARIELGYRIAGPRGKAVAIAPLQVPLPNLLTPGQSLVTAVPVAVPAKPGRYCVTFLASQPLRRKNKAVPGNCGEMELVVAVDAQETHIHSAAAPLVSGAQQTLAEAVAVKNLPTDYADVTQGFLAKWKRLVKQKLLNNFRRGYVDVLARQQSAFNEKVLTTLCQLIDSLQIASHAGGAGSAGEVAELRRDLRQLRRHCRQLERRLAAVEQSKASADAPVRPAGVNYKEALT